MRKEVYEKNNADGSPLTIDLNELKPKTAKAVWFNPRDGERQPIGKFETNSEHTFEPHSHGHGSDWLLILK